MKKIFQVTFWLIITAGVFILLGFVSAEKGALKCNELKVFMVDSQTEGFIVEAEVIKMIGDEFGNISGMCMDSINTDAIEGFLRENPYVRSVDVYSSMTGDIAVEIQREVADLRIYNKNNESYYLTANGKPLPLKRDFVPHTLIARGFIPESYQDVSNSYWNVGDESPENTISQIRDVADQIKTNTFMQQHVDQIYLNSNKDFELIPCNGRYVILLGDACGIESKINNLLAFYEQGLSRINIENIEVINLEYKNQVICKK